MVRGEREERRFMPTPYAPGWDIACPRLEKPFAVGMSSRLQLSRPPLERMLRIHDELRRGAFTNCTKLATDLEVSRKTIVRDIAFMRDRLELPIEFDVRINA